MAQCPKCKNVLKEEFGIETCKKCGAVVFIDLDDNVTLQDGYETKLEPNILENNVPEVLIDEDLISSNRDSEIEENSLELTADLSVSQVLSQTEPHNFSETSADLFQNQIDAVESPKKEEEFLVETADEPIPENAVEAMSAECFLSEIQLFSDMDAEKFKDAKYFFDIEFSEIDSKDTRQSLLNLLDDERLNLKTDELLPKIQNGTLKIENISAVKTFVIVQSVSHLPIQVSWTLKEIQDLEPESVQNPE